MDSLLGGCSGDGGGAALNCTTCFLCRRLPLHSPLKSQLPFEQVAGTEIVGLPAHTEPRNAAICSRAAAPAGVSLAAKPWIAKGSVAATRYCVIPLWAKSIEACGTPSIGESTAPTCAAPVTIATIALPGLGRTGSPTLSWI